VQKTAKERELLAQIDELDGVGTKRIHRSPNEDNLADLVHHVLRDHGNQLQRDAVLRMNLSELQAAHRAAHALQGEPGITSPVSDDVSMVNPKSVNALLDDLEYGAKAVAEARAQKARDAADRETFEQAQYGLLSGPIDWQAQDDRDRERQQRDLAEIERRDQERAAEADQQDAVDAARRTANWRQTGAVDYTVTDVGATPQPRREYTYPEPRVHEADTPGVGESFRIPTLPQPLDTYTVAPDVPVTVKEQEAGKTIRVPIGGETMNVIDSGESFRIPILPKEEK
jgi:hypothetical protein